MGLKEKQALAGLDVSWSEKSLKNTTGNDIKIELDVNSFNDDMDAILLVDQKGAMAAANGVSKLCYNDIGKEAFNELKVSVVKLINHKEEGAKKVIISNGIMELHGSWGDKNDYLSESEIKEALENML